MGDHPRAQLWPPACKRALTVDRTSTPAATPVTPELLAWADTILVMESSHRRKLTAQFGPSLRGKRVASLDIPDDFDYMQPALVELLLAKVPRYLPPRG